MSYFSAIVSGRDGISSEYRPAGKHFGIDVPASVAVRLGGVDAYLNLSIEDARVLVAQLPLVLAEHSQAERDPAAVADWSGDSEAA